jgi:tRNA(Ile)-lysidine synthase
MLKRLIKPLGITVVVGHVDHGLRARSAADRRFVESFARRFDLPFVVREVAAARHARHAGISLETAARELRYQALVGMAREDRCAIVATGHSASDIAETMIWWMARGTGMDGLRGIPRTRELAPGISVTRPLAPLSRKEIEAYDRSQGLRWRTDETNRDTMYTRNYIRRCIVPLLEKINPGAVRNLYRLSVIADREAGALDAVTRAAEARCVRRKGRLTVLDLPRFLSYNKTIQYRLLRDMLPENRSYEQVERLAALLAAGIGTTAVISRRVRARRSRASLTIETARKQGELSRKNQGVLV